MKQKLISIAASLFLASCGTVANATSTQDDLEHCYTLAELSGEIMELRQMGAPMPKVMKTLSQGEGEGNLIRALIEDAYDEPLWSTPENKQRAVTEFSNDIFRLCIKVTN